jgi:hypothetical protein
MGRHNRTAVCVRVMPPVDDGKEWYCVMLGAQLQVCCSSICSAQVYAEAVAAAS